MSTETQELLTCDNVRAIIKDCLLHEDEIDRSQRVPKPKDGVNFATAEGIVTTFGFHVGRLESHRQEIHDLLYCLPQEFQAGKGGGWSFMNMPTRADGSLWGEQQNAEELLCLGLATDQCKYLMPREMWELMPGSMPYIAVV